MPTSTVTPITVGNEFTVTFVVLGASGMPFDPIVVNAKALAPDGTVTVLTPSKTAIGTYTAQQLISQQGMWTVWLYNTTDFPFDTGSTFRAVGIPAGHP